MKEAEGKTRFQLKLRRTGRVLLGKSWPRSAGWLISVLRSLKDATDGEQ
jgi:hypothetical protein